MKEAAPPAPGRYTLSLMSRPRVLGSTSHGARLERLHASPRFRDGAFHNTARVSPGLKGNPLPLLGEYFFGGTQRAPPGPLPLLDPRPAWQRASETGLRVTWLGHSTVLLEVDGVRLLTDPVFGERASPFGFAGPRRFHKTPVRFDELPELDVVLISHDHYDHLCWPTMVQLAKSAVPIVTSLGVGAHLERWGIAAARITELDWGDATQVKGLKLTATPAQHFSGRGVADRNATSWASFVLETERHRVFFSGDTDDRAQGGGTGPAGARGAPPEVGDDDGEGGRCAREGRAAAPASGAAGRPQGAEVVGEAGPADPLTLGAPASPLTEETPDRPPSMKSGFTRRKARNRRSVVSSRSPSPSCNCPPAPRCALCSA